MAAEIPFAILSVLILYFEDDISEIMQALNNNECTKPLVFLATHIHRISTGLRDILFGKLKFDY